MSTKDYGGKIYLTLSPGQKFSLRGTFNISPSSVSVEAITNQDGSVDRVATPKARTFEVSFADRGVNLDVLMRAPRFNATFVEDFTGVSHHFTEAFLTGDPVVNRVNGEVTGLTGASAKYRRTSE